MDERIEEEQRRITSSGFWVVLSILSISLIIQVNVLKADFSQYAVELFTIIFMLVYVGLGYIIKGIEWNPKLALANPIVFSFIVGIGVTLLNAMTNYSRYTKVYEQKGLSLYLFVLALTFGFAFIVALILSISFKCLMKWRQKKIEQELNQ